MAARARRRSRRILAAFGAIAVVLVVAALVGTAGLGPRPTIDTAAPPSAVASTTSGVLDPVPPAWPRSPRRVLFVGDSLSVEAEPFVRELFGADGDTVVHVGFHGTAICDWMPDLRAALDAGPRPDVVIALFSGNALSPCMTARTGGAMGINDDPSLIVRTPQYRAAWRDDTTLLVATTRAAGVPLALVASPASRNFAAANPGERPYVDSLYRAAAHDEASVGYVSLDELLTPGGAFVASLPCIAGEPRCAVGEMVSVRASDGGHLCDPPAFCHGAWRLAWMLHEQLRPR